MLGIYVEFYSIKLFVFTYTFFNIYSIFASLTDYLSGSSFFNLSFSFIIAWCLYLLSALSYLWWPWLLRRFLLFLSCCSYWDCFYIMLILYSLTASFWFVAPLLLSTYFYEWSLLCAVKYIYSALSSNVLFFIIFLIIFLTSSS